MKRFFTAIQRKQFFECVFISGTGKGKSVASGSNLLPRKWSHYVFCFCLNLLPFVDDSPQIREWGFSATVLTPCPLILSWLIRSRNTFFTLGKEEICDGFLPKVNYGLFGMLLQ